MDRKTINDTTPEQILSEFHQAVLSPNAVKLYTGIWKLMAERNATETWITHDLVSRKARLLIQYLPAAQSELARAGILEIIPGDGTDLYGYIESEEEIGAEAS